MPDLAAADVTIVIQHKSLHGRKRKIVGTVAFGDGAKTYPVGGVPMPAIGNFGMYRQMDSLIISGYPGGSTSLFVPQYDVTNNKLQMFAETTVAANQPLIELTNAATPAADTYQFEAWGW
jgi:hypothetical protein